MSWMDSWSRPSKSQATPPPYYLLPGGEKTRYCKSCGRVVGSRKEKSAPTSTPPAYCSVRCRARKPGATDHRIEETFISLLCGKTEIPEDSGVGNVNGGTGYKGGKAGRGRGPKQRRKKGENRILVFCDEVERVCFERVEDPERVFGRRRNRARRGVRDGEVWKSVDMEDGFQAGGAQRRGGKHVLIGSDGEEEGGIGEEEEEEGDESGDGHGGARVSLESADELNEDNLAVLKKENGLQDWLGEKKNHGSVPIEGLARLDVDESSLLSSSTGEIDADVLARLSIRSGTRIRPAQTISEVNGGIGGEKGVKERIIEDEDMLAKRLEGQKRAEEREQVRCAARRLVAFGHVINKGTEDEETLLCEAVMKGEVVESSFAKGDWGVRFRE